MMQVWLKITQYLYVRMGRTVCICRLIKHFMQSKTKQKQPKCAPIIMTHKEVQLESIFYDKDVSVHGETVLNTGFETAAAPTNQVAVHTNITHIIKQASFNHIMAPRACNVGKKQFMTPYTENTWTMQFGTARCAVAGEFCYVLSDTCRPTGVHSFCSFVWFFSNQNFDCILPDGCFFCFTSTSSF